MSVFTPLSEEDIRSFLEPFNVGELAQFKGIRGGSENTNYFVDTRGQDGEISHFVLTLVERGPVNELPFFIELLDCLQCAGLPVPFSVADRHGSALHRLKNRPALLQPRLPGEHPSQPSPLQCAALGELVARMHQATTQSSLQRDNDRGPRWVLQQAGKLAVSDWKNETPWLLPVLTELQHWYNSAPTLPETVIHGDLFRDNAMLIDNHITGVIDFYNAATGWMIMDLAICANDWCTRALDSGELIFQPLHVQSMLDAYARIRPLSSIETRCWPQVLQLAALRFWVSREQYARTHPAQSDVLIKDPGYFRTLFQLHSQHAA
jgi:homoserine kinase type II